MWRNCFMLDRNLTKFTRICSPLKHAYMYKTSKTNQLCDIREFSSLKPVRKLKTFYSLCFIKHKYNDAFNLAELKEGATQAMLHVSYYLSKCEFEQLAGLVEPKALEEIKQNFGKLSEKQRKFLLVREEDLIVTYVYELSIRVDRDTGKEYAEAMVSFRGVHEYTKKLNDFNRLKDNRSRFLEDLGKFMNIMLPVFIMYRFSVKRLLKKLGISGVDRRTEKDKNLNRQKKITNNSDDRKTALSLIQDEKLLLISLGKILESGYTCKYKLVKELTKDLEKDWIIHQLNYISMFPQW